MVAFMEHEDLGLVLEPAEGCRVDNPVTITLEIAASRAAGFSHHPATGLRGPAGKGRPETVTGLTHRTLGLSGGRLPLEVSARCPYLDRDKGDKIAMSHAATTPAETAHPASLSVTERAFARIASVLASEAEGTKLRVAVNGGGCSGFQYVFEMDRSQNEDDIVLSNGAATVLVDEASLGFLAGSTLDFVDDLIGQSFKITNPNATSSCGCGTSFAM
jgi:iron-sulfur cluster assembly accessory protein